MKSKTILSKIKNEQQCSINTMELLTKAMHRENLLEENRVLRFKPLSRDFDIVNSDLFITGNFNKDLCEDIGDLEKLINWYNKKIN